jgi:putative DNA primase/helicase
MLILENIPVTLRARPQWVLWRLVEREGKPTKVPFSPAGTPASVSDPNTWTDFETALEAYRRGGFDGIGFVLTQKADIVCVDIDHAKNGTDWTPEAMEMVGALNSYTEVSPSGQGLHIWCYGHLPAGRRRKNGVEMYDSGRFITVTGNHLPDTPADLQERTQQLADLHRRVFAEPAHTLKVTAPADLSDADLLQRAMNAENGGKFRALWNGDTSGYPSPSEADLALCRLLAFWCGNDPARIERLFSQSALGKREKWQARADYRHETIQTALQSLRETYSWREPNRVVPPPGNRDEAGGNGGGEPGVMTKFVPRKFSERILQEHRFVAWGDLRTGDFLRYDPDVGIWRDDAEAFIANLLREGNLLPEEWKTQARVMEISNDIRQWCWQPDPMPEPPLTLIPFANGVLDLDTGDLRPYRPEDGFRSKLQWDYNPNAQSHVLAKRLHAVPEGIRQHFFELLAYCLWRSYPFQRFFVWVGRGSNGKSYLLRLLTLALGSENVSNVGLHALGEDRFAKAELHGKLLNISGEMRYEDITDTDALKALTGGDYITADRKYKSPITFQNHAKVLFAGNTLPVTRDTTDAFFRRAYVVEFEHQFREDPRVDNELALLPPDVLGEEFSWLLTEAVGVLQDLRARGFVFSNDLPVEEKRARYLALSHPLRQFIAETCEVTRRADDFIYKFEFRDRFNEWLEQRGFNAYTDTRLGREMREIFGFEDGQRGEKRWFAWLGIRWADKSAGGDSNSSKSSNSSITRIEEDDKRFIQPFEPFEPFACDHETNEESHPDLPPHTTPVGTAIRAIEAVLSGGKRMSRLELYRATGLPPIVFKEAFEHMVATGQLVADRGDYMLPAHKASTGGADRRESVPNATTPTSANENTEQCIGEDSLPPNITPVGTAVRAIEAALSGGKRMNRLELYEATGLPPTVFEDALQHMLTTGELFAEAGAYGLHEVIDDV